MTLDYIKIKNIHGSYKCGKTHIVLDLIEKEYNKYFDYIIIAQQFEIIRQIIPKSRLKMMIKFDLLNLKKSSISGLGGCHSF